MVRLPGEREVAPLLVPVRHSREGRCPRASTARPQIENNRLPGGVEAEPPFDRKLAIRHPPVLAEGEERHMRLEERDGLLLPLVQLDLELYGIGLQVHEAAGLVVLRSRRRTAVQIDYEGRVAVQLPQLRIAHSVTRAVGMQRLEAPAVAEIEALHDVTYEARGKRRTVVVGVAHQHRRSA